MAPTRFSQTFLRFIGSRKKRIEWRIKWISSLKSDESSWALSTGNYYIDSNSLFFFFLPSSFLVSCSCPIRFVSCPQLGVMRYHISLHEEALLAVFETWKHLRGCRKKHGIVLKKYRELTILAALIYEWVVRTPPSGSGGWCASFVFFRLLKSR